MSTTIVGAGERTDLALSVTRPAKACSQDGASLGKAQLDGSGGSHVLISNLDFRNASLANPTFNGLLKANLNGFMTRKIPRYQNMAPYDERMDE